MRRIFRLALVVLAVLAVLWGAAGLRSTEPVYAGRRLSDWLDSGGEPAALAVHEIGPAATPWILKKLRWEHPSWGWWEEYQRFWRRLPELVRKVLPKPHAGGFDEFKATAALLEVGPAVIPQLAAALREKDPAVRMVCAMTLGALRERGFADPGALAALRADSQDKHREVRAAIATAIAKAGWPPRP